MCIRTLNYRRGWSDVPGQESRTVTFGSDHCAICQLTARVTLIIVLHWSQYEFSLSSLPLGCDGTSDVGHAISLNLTRSVEKYATLGGVNLSIALLYDEPLVERTRIHSSSLRPKYWLVAG